MSSGSTSWSSSGVLAASERAANHEMDRRYASGEASPLEYVRFYLSYYPPHDMAALLALAREVLRAEDPAADAARGAARWSTATAATWCDHHRHQPLPDRADRRRVRRRAPDRHRAADRATAASPATSSARPACARARSRASTPGSRRAARRSRDFAQSWFYSDSINDLPLLERVTHPVAVDADAKLADIAAERGWRQLTLR